VSSGDLGCHSIDCTHEAQALQMLVDYSDSEDSDEGFDAEKRRALSRRDDDLKGLCLSVILCTLLHPASFQ
jgi:hypothetical protein